MQRRISKLAGLLVAIVVGFAPALHGLTFEEVVARMDRTNAVRQAMVSVDVAQRELTLLTHPGSPSLSLEPTVKALSQVAESFAEEVDLTASLGARLPIALSDIEREKAEAAADSVEAAIGDLKRARERAFLDLVGLYRAAFLAQDEEDVLQAEEEATRATADALRQLFEAGEVALIDFSRAEEELKRVEQALLAGRHARRITWIELALAADIALSPETPRLEPVSLNVGEPPVPRRLAAWAADHDAAVVAQRRKIVQLQRTIARLGKKDLELSVRGFLNTDEHDASLTYNFSDPELSGAYTFPLVTFGEVPTGGGSATDPWSTGLALSLNYRSGRTDSLASKALVAEVAREMLRLESLEMNLELAIRIHYQGWIKAQAAVDQAERLLERTLQDKNIVTVRQVTGLAGDYEGLVAQAAVTRAEWELGAAVVDEVEARMTVAEAASYLGEITEIGGE